MTTRNVLVERYVEQVLDGSHYRGYVKITGTKLYYDLVFRVPIPQLDSMEPAKSEDEVRQLFQLTVKRDNTNIELTKEEYIFFFSMVVKLVVDFYNDPHTRDSQEGFLGLLLSGRGPMTEFGASASIVMTHIGSCDFPPKICNMLSTPKFGCALTT